MAEILLSLTIIGVVAAITLPSLTGNINERTWNTQRKALYARISQAISLMPALNGYGTLIEGNSSTSAVDTAAETFVTSGLAKVLKINNICDSDHLEDCGLSEKIQPYSGGQIQFPTKMSELNDKFVGFSESIGNNSYSQIDTKAAAFETANGESIAVYYNPNCRTFSSDSSWWVASWHATQPYICANFVFDLNGNKGPNTVGKDIGFITVINPSDSNVVMPNVFFTNPVAGSTNTYQMSSRLCREQDADYRLPNRDELISMFANKNLIGITDSDTSVTHYMSATRESDYVWLVATYAGTAKLSLLSSARGYVRCVKR